MADRTVSVALRADVAGYIAGMKAAERATRSLADTGDRMSRRTGTSFDAAAQSATAMSGSFRQAGQAARQSAADVEKGSLAVRRAQLAASDATDKATKSQQQATDAAKRYEQAALEAADANRMLARGGMDEAQAATYQERAEKARRQSLEASTRAERDAERALIAHADASLRASKEADKQTASNERMRRSTDQTTRGLTANRATLVSLVSAVGLAGAGVTAAGVAFGAFGVIAAGSIAKVVSAQTDLTVKWSSLTTEQQAAALSVRALTNDYQRLSRSFEPQAMAAFNSVLGTTRVLLPQLGALADDTADDVIRLVNRLGEFTTGRLGGEFLTWTGQQAPYALDVFGNTMITAGDTALDLVQDIAPLGLTVLQLTNGVLSAVNAVANFNPLLAQFALSALALRAPVAGLVAGVGNLSGRMRGAQSASGALNATAAAGTAVWTAAGVALGFIALRLADAAQATSRETTSLRESYGATGNNIAGYRALLTVLHQKEAALSGNAATEEEARKAAFAHAHELAKLQKQQQAVAAAARNVTLGAQQLASTYNLSTDAATRLATAAGVDLSVSMTKSGTLTESAAAKVEQYVQSVRLAADPTRVVALALQDAGNAALAMKDRVTALQTALDAIFTPSLQVYQATTQMKQGYQQLIAALTQSKHGLDGNSAASLRAQQAFASQLQSVSQLYAATFRQSGSTRAASAAVAAQLPVLYALAGANTNARAQVDALARSTGNSGRQATLSKQAFLAQAAQMGIVGTRAQKLWTEYGRLTGQLGNVTSASNRADYQMVLLARERHLRLNIAEWNRQIERGKDRLKTVPPDKRAKLLADIRQLERKVKEAKDELNSIHDKTVTVKINEVTRRKIIGKGPGHGQAAGGIYGPGMVRRYARGDITRATPVSRPLDPNITTGPIALYGEAGPEAYIPLSPSRRGHSTEILTRVADMFGMRLVPMAAGGTTGGRVRGTGGQPEGGYRDLISTLVDTRGEMDGSTASAQKLQDRFNAQLAVVRTLNTATGEQARQVNTASAAARTQLPLLASLTARSTQARVQTDALARATAAGTGRQNTATAAFARAGREMGTTRARTENLWREYSRVPGQTGRAAAGVEGFSARTRRSLSSLRGKNLTVVVTADGKFRKASALAGGGPVRREWALAGGGPTEDDVPLWGSVNEHMWTADEVKGAGGHQAMYRMRAAARRGELRLAAGGAVDFAARVPNPAATSGAVGVGGEHLKLARSGQAAFEEAKSLAAVWKKYMASGGAAVAWARTQAGKPYVWGGVGPGGYDCSGWWSALRNVIAHRYPHRRLFTTHSFGGSAPSGFVRGLRSPVMVGVTSAGVGHMAGTISGVNLESSGGAGVRVGGGARGAGNSLFTRQYGLKMATGGAVTADARRLADKVLRLSAAREEIALAATLGLIGDPSSPISPAKPEVPGYAGGGWVKGRGGSDRVPLLGTAGEFMVNRTQAAANGPLLEAVNAGLGEALLRRTIRAGLVPSGGPAQRVTVELHNHGVIGSRLEVQNWLSKSLDDLGRQGRAPWATKG